MVLTLPYTEQEDLYLRLDRRAGWGSPHNQAVLTTPLPHLRCPDWYREDLAGQSWQTPYLGMAGLGGDAPTLPPGHVRAGVFGYDRGTAREDISDGQGQTLAVLESARHNGPWGRGGAATLRALDPTEQPYLGTGRPLGGTHFEENTLFRKGRSVGCQAGMADGSTRFLVDSISPKVLEALVTIQGGDRLEPGW